MSDSTTPAKRQPTGMTGGTPSPRRMGVDISMGVRRRSAVARKWLKKDRGRQMCESVVRMRRTTRARQKFSIESRQQVSMVTACLHLPSPTPKHDIITEVQMDSTENVAIVCNCYLLLRTAVQKGGIVVTGL